MPSILLVEDNKISQKVLLTMLRHLGYYPELAENGLEALRTLENHHYDLVIMDIMMPEMDGLKATTAIRARLPPAEQPYIIAMTACAIIYDIKLCIDTGMDDHLSKPVSMGELRTAIGRFQAKGIRDRRLNDKNDG